MIPLKALLPKRKPDTHKGDYGCVLILAGSLGLTGAAELCAKAAMRCGSGMVTLGIPEGLATIMGIKLTEAMTRPLPQTEQRTLSIKGYGQIEGLSRDMDVLALGPGLSLNPSTQALVRKIISTVDIPMVIDADGINALVGYIDKIKKSPPRADSPSAKNIKILTPHPGEMARLIDEDIEYVQKDRCSIAKRFARDYNVILVLKGYKTVVANPDGEFYINKTGNPGMATAGSGDVLTGMITSFLGQGLRAFDAAKLGVYLHGLAGDLSAKEKGEHSLIATDIIEKIPEAIRKIT